jgi:hypothetical protein
LRKPGGVGGGIAAADRSASGTAAISLIAGLRPGLKSPRPERGDFDLSSMPGQRQEAMKGAGSSERAFDI